MLKISGLCGIHKKRKRFEMNFSEVDFLIHVLVDTRLGAGCAGVCTPCQAHARVKSLTPLNL